MRQFLWGTLAMASATAALIFLRYRSLSRDRLFAYFSAAFAILAFNWIVLAVIEPHFEHRHLAYLLRLVAFALIIVGIIDKNVRATPP